MRKNKQTTLGIGDGANDLEMIAKAGIGIAFCAKRALQEQAQVIMNIRDLELVGNYFF